MTAQDNPFQFSSSLAIGTTGMLRDATKVLAELSRQTLAVSRRAEESLHANPLERVTAINADYCNTEAFIERVALEVELASIDCAVLWIRGEGLGVLFALLERLANQPIRIVHITGSAAGDPEKQMKRINEKVSFGKDCNYCPVILGAMPAPSGRRWLTHEEICAGTIKAIKSGNPQMIGHRLADLDETD